ncbi:Peptidase family M49 [Sulfidibacter corallicola]
MIYRLTLLVLLCLALACNQGGGQTSGTDDQTQPASDTASKTKSTEGLSAERKNMYIEVTLTTDVAKLTENQRKMIPLLVDVAKIMDRLFWAQSYGDKQQLLESIEDPDVRRFAEINYGPWDRLMENEPFLPGVGPKPDGAMFYPADVTKEEVEQADEAVRGQYTMVRRKEDGSLYAIPYREFFKQDIEMAAAKLDEAAALAEDAGLKQYLTLRAEALRTDDYLASDMAWMDMKTNAIDFVVGPIENYEDKLFNYKSAHEAYILVKDMEWSKRLEKYAALLPELQAGIPVEAAYKKEKPGTDSDLNAYDVVYYAGDCNAGSKTIAINLPNDERVQLEKGTRRLQLKNAMRAKFDKILVPLADVLIDEGQRNHITFDAFFANTMFHEVAHGLGIKNTIDGKGTVREALKEKSSPIEEGKADILGLYMIGELLKKGELEGDIKDYYVTFVAGIFRSMRFGGASAHGQANMLRFHFFMEQGAIMRDAQTNTYKVDFEKMPAAVAALSQKILKLQGDGDYEGVTQWFKEKGHISDDLKNDLARVATAGIPRDIVFKQGTEVLGLNPQP